MVSDESDADMLLENLLNEFLGGVPLQQDPSVLRMKLHVLDVIHNVLDAVPDLDKKFPIFQSLYTSTLHYLELSKNLRKQIFSKLTLLTFSRQSVGNIAIVNQSSFDARAHVHRAVPGVGLLLRHDVLPCRQGHSGGLRPLATN